MKNIILSLLVLFCFCTTIVAQEASVEKSLFGLQIGPTGVWGHNELRMSPTSTIKIEAGLQFDNVYSTGIRGNRLHAFPDFNVEPRWYYNLGIRKNKEKNISQNSGNFLGLFIKARTGRTLTVRNEEMRLKEDYAAYVRWGFKRTYGKHFTLETAVGPGLVLSNSSNTQELFADINIQFRIGYTF